MSSSYIILACSMLGGPVSLGLLGSRDQIYLSLQLLNTKVFSVMTCGGHVFCRADLQVWMTPS